MSRAWIDLLRMLHYTELRGPVTGQNVAPVLERFGIPFDDRDLKIKAAWHQFKQFHVYNVDGTPMFFIKELWQAEFFREILGLHIGMHFLDSELGPKGYLFGMWRRDGKSDKPILITTYVKGNSLKKAEVDGFMHAIGRQYAYHQVLSMYDVDYRHFIVQGGNLARIDYGRSFSNLHMAFQGFWDFSYKRLLKSRAFHEGMAEEVVRIANQLDTTRGHLLLLLKRLDAIGADFRNFFVDFSIPAFLDQLRRYWDAHAPMPVLPG